MNWEEFKRAAPELAALGEKLFDRSGVILVGTIRKDGSPRISPVEPLITDGQLYIGMIWQSLKALDLLRDPRCTIHSSISDRKASEGEFKLHGRALDIRDLLERSRYCQALYEKIGWKPEEPNYHLFSIDIKTAGSFTTEGDARIVKRWRVDAPLSQFRQYADGRIVPII